MNIENIDNVLGGVVVGHIQLTVAVQKTRVLKAETQSISSQVGATDRNGKANGSLTVSSRLWKGSRKVVALFGEFASTNRVLKAATLPWKKGEVVFNASRAAEIDSLVATRFNAMEGLITDICGSNPLYLAEMNDALMAMGSSGDRALFPADADAFRRAVVRAFPCHTLAASDTLVNLVGGALGRRMADESRAENESQLKKSQRDVLYRIKEWLERMKDICDPGKNRTRITDVLLPDLAKLVKDVPKLLLVSDPEIESTAMAIGMAFSGFTDDELSENKSARTAAHAKVEESLSLLASCGLVV